MLRLNTIIGVSLLIVPFRVTIATTNTPKQLFSTTDNLILASMVSGSSNTIGMFGLGGVPTGAFAVNRLKFAADTAVSVQFGVYNGTNFWQIWSTYLTETQYFGVDEDFTPKSRTTFPIDYLIVPQSDSYTAAFRLSTAPGGNVNIAGFVEVANVPATQFPILVA